MPAAGPARHTSPTTTQVWRGLAGMAVVALAAALVAVATGGAAEAVPEGLTDPGVVVRWGLPIVRVIHDLAAALTTGLVLLGAVAVPDRAPEALARVRRVGVRAGLLWIGTGLVGVVLGFADVAGTPLTDPTYLPQFTSFVWSVEPLREGIISAIIVGLSLSALVISTGRVGMLWSGALALIALFPLALAGHSSTAVDHETAVNGLLFHLVGAVAWVGGLMALFVLRGPLGSWLPVVARRYSVIAGWALLTVTVSGIVSALVRISLSDLGTAYGLVVVAKVVALFALGGIGFVQRRRYVERLRDSDTARSAFIRLVALELLVMGAAFGLATALARTPGVNTERPPASTLAEVLTNYPIPAAPEGLAWLTTWRWDWLWGTISVVAIALYVGAHVRLRRRGDRWPIGRTICWVLGWLVMLWATCGSAGVYGRVSFSWHMMSHMTIAMVAPILLVLGAPITLVLRAQHPRKDGTWGPREILLGLVHSRYVAFWANPVVAGINFAFSLIIFYYTKFFTLALVTHTGHVLMIVHFLLAGYLFAMVLIGVDPGPRKWAPALRLVVLFATISFHAFFGVAMQSSTTLLAPDFFGQIKIPWIPDPLADQRNGGAIAWGIGDLPALALALLVVLSWVRSDEAEARRLDRKADRDGDADLVAYNERLADLARHDEERTRHHRQQSGGR